MSTLFRKKVNTEKERVFYFIFKLQFS